MEGFIQSEMYFLFYFLHFFLLFLRIRDPIMSFSAVHITAITVYQTASGFYANFLHYLSCRTGDW